MGYRILPCEFNLTTFNHQENMLPNFAAACEVSPEAHRPRKCVRPAARFRDQCCRVGASYFNRPGMETTVIGYLLGLHRDKWYILGLYRANGIY